MKRIILFSVAFFTAVTLSKAQSVSINNGGNPAHESSILDVSSANKGLLIPRLNTSQRLSISNPARSLLVFDNTTGSFWYYDSGWIELDSDQLQNLTINGDNLEISQGNSVSLVPYLDNTDNQTLSISGSDLSISGGNTITLPLSGTSPHQIEDADGDTRVSTENTADEDQVSIFLAGIERVRIHNNGAEFNTGTNLSLGNNSGLSLTGGSGSLNLFVGNEAGSSFTQGFYNTVLGIYAGRNLDGGSSNVIIGAESGTNLIDGNSNVLIGDYVGNSLTTGSTNTLIGTSAGNNLQSGDGNIFIGNQAGALETGSNKLYIDNVGTSTPLIYGEFDTDLLVINGELNIGSNYSFPQADGTSGQVITTDGNGVLSWASISGGSGLFAISSNTVSYTGDLDNDDFVFGSPQLNEDGVDSHDSRFYFDKSKSAFRAGIAGGDQWDDANVGNRSFAAGLNTIANGSVSAAFGSYCEASGNSSFALGFETRAQSVNSMALGRYNIGGGNAFFLNDDDPIFEVGVGSPSTRTNGLTVLKGGKVIIGEHTDYNIGGDFELVVDGGLLCESIKVQDSGNWPDYVFEDDYELMTFDELRSHIASERHLPGVPSAAEINGNGVELEEMTEVLLEKVEELTLYVLQLEAEIEELKNK